MNEWQEPNPRETLAERCERNPEIFGNACISMPLSAREIDIAEEELNRE